MNLQFKVSGQQLTLLPAPAVVADSRNYLYARFAFSNEWADAAKTAVFKAYDGTVYHMLLVGDACAVPPEVLCAPWFTVSVFGGDRLTAGTVTVPVEPSGCEEGITPPQPTPDIYQQLLEQVAQQLASKQDVLTEDSEVDVRGVQATTGAFSGGLSVGGQPVATGQTVSALPVRAAAKQSGSLLALFGQQTAPGYYLVTASSATEDMPFAVGNGYLLLQFIQTGTGGRYVLTAQNAEKYAYATGTPTSGGAVSFGAWTVTDLSAVATQAYVDGLVGSVNDALEARLGGQSNGTE